jgi:hypothetical protein
MTVETATSKPLVLPVNAEEIPRELKALAQWVCWRWEQSANGKWTKPPFSVHSGAKCDKTSPSAWCDFEAALAACQAGRFDGIGFCFTPDDPFAGIDLDDCRNPDTGELTATAQHILLRCGSYAEVSQNESRSAATGDWSDADFRRRQFNTRPGQALEAKASDLTPGMAPKCHECKHQTESSGGPNQCVRVTGSPPPVLKIQNGKPECSHFTAKERKNTYAFAN